MAFIEIAYWKIILGLTLGTVCSFGIVSFGFGDFLTLLVTALLFFGAYGFVLLITHEKLTIEIFSQILGKISKRGRKDEKSAV